MAGTRLREPLSKVDTAWLHMNAPTNLMMVTSVLLFDEQVDEARLRRVMHARLLPYARFRQRITTPLRRFREPTWELVEDFDLDDHVHHVTLPAPGGDSELRKLVGLLMSTPLDQSKPLWDMHMVDGYCEGTAIVVRIHHSIADGIALVRLLLSLTDSERDAEADGGIPVWKRYEAAARHHTASSGQRLAGFVRLGLREAERTLRRPLHGVEMVRSAAGGLAAFVRVSTLPTEPHMALKGQLGTRKKPAWSKPIPLDEVKAIARQVEGTVNDVLVTATAGAIRRYLLERGDDVDGLTIHATVPVNLRPPSGRIELGNRFGLVYPALPVGIPDPLGRVRAVKQQMDALKASPEAVMAIGVLNLLGRSPIPVERAALELFTSKSSMVLTNVPGPRTLLYYAGSPVRRILVWAPPSGNLSMSVSIYSYAGEVTIGVASDVRLVPDPEHIVDAVQAELEALGEAARPRTTTPRARKRAKPPARRISAHRERAASAAGAPPEAEVIPGRERS
jgi:WS/DGAT/MGAT family acyltransferase